MIQDDRRKYITSIVETCKVLVKKKKKKKPSYSSGHEAVLQTCARYAPGEDKKKHGGNQENLSSNLYLYIKLNVNAHFS